MLYNNFLNIKTIKCFLKQTNRQKKILIHLEFKKIPYGLRDDKKFCRLKKIKKRHYFIMNS